MGHLKVDVDVYLGGVESELARLSTGGHKWLYRLREELSPAIVSELRRKYGHRLTLNRCQTCPGKKIYEVIIEVK